MNIFGQSRKVSAFLTNKLHYHAIFKINNLSEHKILSASYSYKNG
jgi:hypothetical protein